MADLLTAQELDDLWMRISERERPAVERLFATARAAVDPTGPPVICDRCGWICGENVLEDLVADVVRTFGVSKEDILSRSKRHPVPKARHTLILRLHTMGFAPKRIQETTGLSGTQVKYALYGASDLRD